MKSPYHQLPVYTTPRPPPPFARAATSATRGNIPARAIVRAAAGFSQNKAMKAATMSQAIIAQRTGTQLPVRVDARAATGPAKIDANPFAV